MRAATTAFERMRRDAMVVWRPADHGPYLAPRTYVVGDLVWCYFGQRGVQLARVVMDGPVAFGGLPEWWCVDVWWPRRGWRMSHRRVLRALTPAEARAVRETGVCEEPRP